MQGREVACRREVRSEEIGAAERRCKGKGRDVVVIRVVAGSRARVCAKLDKKPVSRTGLLPTALVGEDNEGCVYILEIDSWLLSLSHRHVARWGNDARSSNKLLIDKLRNVDRGVGTSVLAGL